MNAGGWIIMFVSVLGMSTLFFWCIRKVLTLPDATDHLHSQVDINPKDQE